MSVNADVPSLEAILVEEYDPHVNALGIKGVGEIGITGTAGAVANAVWHATGNPRAQVSDHAGSHHRVSIVERNPDLPLVVHRHAVCIIEVIIRYEKGAVSGARLDADTLERYIADPQSVVAGTRLERTTVARRTGVAPISSPLSRSGVGTAP